MRRTSVRFLPDNALLLDPEPVFALRAVRRGERERIVATSFRRGRFALAEQKMPDLNCTDSESAISMIAGTCRSMGVVVGD